MLQDLINEDTRGPGFPASYKYDGLLRELAALLVPHIVEHPSVQALLGGAAQLVTREQVEEIVQAKVDDLGLIDKVFAREIVRGELDLTVEELVKAKMDELGPLDKDMIREVCEEVVDASDIDDKINDYMSSNFDISDYESEIKDIVDIDDALEDRLPDAVATCVQGLTFTVGVSRY